MATARVRMSALLGPEAAGRNTGRPSPPVTCAPLRKPCSVLSKSRLALCNSSSRLDGTGPLAEASSLAYSAFDMRCDSMRCRPARLMETASSAIWNDT